MPSGGSLLHAHNPTINSPRRNLGLLVDLFILGSFPEAVLIETAFIKPIGIHEYMYINIHMYIYIYIHMYIHTCIYTHVHPYLYIYIHVYIHININKYMYIYIYIRIYNYTIR